MIAVPDNFHSSASEGKPTLVTKCDCIMYWNCYSTFYIICKAHHHSAKAWIFHFHGSRQQQLFNISLIVINRMTSTYSHQSEGVMGVLGNKTLQSCCVMKT